jgi:putative flippase GtrA
MVVRRFLIVGLACALLHNAVMIGGDWFGWHYVVSSIVSFAIVVVVGYLLHSGWTYAGAERGGTSFARYALVASGNLPLSIAAMFLLVDVLGLAVPLAAPLATVLLVLFNFAGNRWALRAGRA